MAYCGKCGAENPDGDFFCHKCGSKLFLNEKVKVEVEEPSTTTFFTESKREVYHIIKYDSTECNKYRIPAIVFMILGIVSAFYVVMCMNVGYSAVGNADLELNETLWTYINKGADSAVFDFLNNSTLLLLVIIYLLCIVLTLICPHFSFVSAIAPIIIFAGMMRINLPLSAFKIITVDMEFDCQMEIALTVILFIPAIFSIIGGAFWEKYCYKFGLEVPLSRKIKGFWTE